MEQLSPLIWEIDMCTRWFFCTKFNSKQLSFEAFNNYNTNIFVAIFTTANAHLRLYEILQKLGEAVVYCDTDSIVYIDNGRNTVKTGDLLDEWTDELGENVHMEKWLGLQILNHITIAQILVKTWSERIYIKQEKLLNN